MISKFRRTMGMITFGVLAATLGLVLRVNQISPGLRAYAKAELPKIMTEKERELGIKFDSTPSIDASMPALVEFHGSFEDYATYTPKRETIYLNHKFNNYPARNFLDIMLGRYNLSNNTNSINVESNLKHELAHHYVNQITEKFDFSEMPQEIEKYRETFKKYHELKEAYINEPTIDNQVKLQNFSQAHLSEISSFFAFKSIDEGTAEYFRKATNDNSDMQINWSRNPAEIGMMEENILVYLGGYKLVKPLIAKYGGRAIQAFVRNPPVVSSLSDLPAYTNAIERILQEETRK